MLIGLSGKAGCGKDTVGHYLHTKHDYAQFRFAAPIKAALAPMLGVSPAVLEMREYKDAPLPGLEKTPRQMMQTLGTEWGRELISPDLWVWLLERRYRATQPTNAVITDVRFENEAKWIRKNGGVIIHIHRGDLKPLPGEHVSESGITQTSADVVLENASTLVCLFASVENALKRLESGAMPLALTEPNHPLQGA